MSGVKDRYIEGDVDTQIVGDVVMFEDAANTIRPVSATYPLPVAASNNAVEVVAPSFDAAIGYRDWRGDCFATLAMTGDGDG